MFSFNIFLSYISHQQPKKIIYRFSFVIPSTCAMAVESGIRPNPRVGICLRTLLTCREDEFPHRGVVLQQLLMSEPVD